MKHKTTVLTKERNIGESPASNIGDQEWHMMSVEDDSYGSRCRIICSYAPGTQPKFQGSRTSPGNFNLTTGNEELGHTIVCNVVDT